MVDIPNTIEWFEIPDFLAGKKKPLTDQGLMVVAPPIPLLNIGKRYKGDSRAAARRGKNGAAPTPTKGGKKK